MFVTHEMIKQKWKALSRPLLGSFEGQTALDFAANNTFFGAPFMLFCRIFSHLATVQQIELIVVQYYMLNLAYRCLCSLQLSNFLVNDFASMIVRKPHQHQRHLTAIVDINRQISVHTKLPKPVYSLNISFEDHESNRRRFWWLPCPLYIYYSMFGSCHICTLISPCMGWYFWRRKRQLSSLSHQPLYKTNDQT